MAQLVIHNPALADIPQHLIDFAVSQLGWVEVEPGVIAAPGADTGVGFRFVVNLTGTTAHARGLSAILVSNGVVLNDVRCDSPYVGLSYSEPTRLRMFGGTEGRPYFGICIEYLPGSFRHMYVGYVNIRGDYTGGEITTGTRYSAHTNDRSYTHEYHSFPFGGTQSVPNGTVRMVHQEFGGEYSSEFQAATNHQWGGRTNGRSFGGYLDQAANGLIGFSSDAISANALLVPFNIFQTLPSSRSRPIGTVGGVRMVNMTDLDVGTRVSVGNRQWECYPLLRKGGTSGVNAGSWDVVSETSYILGIAYLVE